ncbi:MAG: hypothetical protein HYY93_16750 [Planctomycetes bacterium]|nr:hypothetical protein [Planctomycetota bacterium]
MNSESPPLTAPRSPVEARGSGGAFFLAAGILALIALGMPVVLVLTGTPLGGGSGGLSLRNVLLIWLGVAGVDLLLLVSAAYYRSRRLVLADGVLTLSTWFSRNSWPAASITAATKGSSHFADETVPEEYVVFWTGKNVLFELSFTGWRSADLRRLLSELKRQVPALQVAPEVSGLFGG